jgi:hypothetical protein
MITALRRGDRGWDEISKSLYGRTSQACRLRYLRYLKGEKQHEEWDKIARLYEKYRTTQAILVCNTANDFSLDRVQGCGPSRQRHHGVSPS